MKALLSRACVWIDRANAAGAAFSAICCAILAAMLFAEVVSTAGFDWSQPWSVEYSAYLCAVVLLAGSGYAVRHSAHIRVRLVLAHLPAPIATTLDFICTAIALAIASTLAYGMVELAFRSWERGSVSYFVMQTPLAVPQGLLAAASLLLALALLARAVRLLIGEAPDLIADGILGETGPE